MKYTRLFLAMASSVLLGACSTFTPQSGPAYRVGPDYTATGSTTGVRAYVYGDRTLLEYERDPYFISISDVTGQPVAYEKEGKYYRLDRTVRDFTVRADLFKATVFHLAKPKAPKPAPVVAKPAPVPEALRVFTAPDNRPPVQVQRQEDADLSAALAELQNQLTAVRASIEHGAPDAASIERLNARMDQIQAKLANTSSTVLMVYFDLYKSGFEPKPEVASLLLSVAKTADAVKVRGRTDSVVAGPADARIAKARAMSAQSYLVAHGISPTKIHTSWLPAGDFIAPNTAEGKALNRRVEIEFVTPGMNSLRKLNGNRVANAEVAP
jgi:outer membrane protein OmpA-like peptidoglycan-associated protein